MLYIYVLIDKVRHTQCAQIYIQYTFVYDAKFAGETKAEKDAKIMRKYKRLEDFNEIKTLCTYVNCSLKIT